MRPSISVPVSNAAPTQQKKLNYSDAVSGSKTQTISGKSFFSPDSVAGIIELIFNIGSSIAMV